MAELPNDSEGNPCWACGPNSPVGLRMRFFEDEDAVRSPLVLDDRFCGYPGRVLTGVLFSALEEACFWAAYARWRTFAVDDGRPEVEFLGVVRTGSPFVVEAREAERRDAWTVWEAVAVQDGEVRARVRVRQRPRTRAELEEMARREGMPRSVVEEALAFAEEAPDPPAPAARTRVF